MKIGIFDSGLGGHFTLIKCEALLPQHEFVGYFDTINAPYGDRPQSDILKFTETGINTLFQQHCDLVLIACNTACTQALRRLQEKHVHHKILGCLIPAAETAADTHALNIGLIGTQRTIDSKKYDREIFKINQKAKLYSLATPKLVPFIEGDLALSDEALNYLCQSVETLIENHHIETLILGCTHYSVYKDWLNLKYPHLTVIDSAEAQAIKLGNYLKRHPELE